MSAENVAPRRQRYRQTIVGSLRMNWGRDRIEPDLQFLERAGEAGVERRGQLLFELATIDDRVRRPALERTAEQSLPDGAWREGHDHLAARGAMDRGSTAEPVDADHRSRARRLLDGDYLIRVENIEGDGFTEGSGQPLAHRASHVSEVELPRDHAGKLRQTPAEPVFGGAGIALDKAVPFQRAEQPEGGRPVDAKISRHLGARSPAVPCEKVEDGHSAVDRADDPWIAIGAVVAHRATIQPCEAPGTGVDCWPLSIC